MKRTEGTGSLAFRVSVSPAGTSRGPSTWGSWHSDTSSVGQNTLKKWKAKNKSRTCRIVLLFMCVPDYSWGVWTALLWGSQGCPCSATAGMGWLRCSPCNTWHTQDLDTHNRQNRKGLNETPADMNFIENNKLDFGKPALLSSQSFQCHSDIISMGGGAVVVAVIDQHCCLPAVWAAWCYRFVAAGENSQRAAVGSCWVQNLSENLRLSLKRKQRDD